MRSTTKILALSATAALVLSGCGGGGEVSGGGSQLTFASYGSEYQDAQNDSLLTPWAEEAGVTVTNDSPTSYPRIAQMVDAGQVTWDVVDTEPFYPVANCGTYVEELDFSNIDTSQFPEGTWSDCSIPFAQYATIMVYDAEQFTQAPQDFEAFFDVENYPGTRLVPNWAGGGALEVALLADGVAPEELYPLDLDRAFAKLDTIRDHLQFWDTSSESQQALEDGTVDLALVWSGRAYEAELNGSTFEPVWQDALLAWASLSIIKDSPNLEAAQSLIEYAAQAEPQARFAERQPYSPANLEAQPELDEVQEKYNVAAPDVQDQAIVTDVQYWADHNDEANEAWTAWSTS